LPTAPNQKSSSVVRVRIGYQRNRLPITAPL